MHETIPLDEITQNADLQNSSWDELTSLKVERNVVRCHETMMIKTQTCCKVLNPVSKWFHPFQLLSSN